jgi:hypothetical protein
MSFCIGLSIHEIQEKYAELYETETLMGGGGGGGGGNNIKI